MTWFKVDDQFAMHPKSMSAGNAALGLWVRAGSWSAAHLTDGRIPSELLPALGGNSASAKRLVKAGLWDVEPDGYQFRDWSDYQPLAEDVKAAEAAEKDGGSWGNHVRWHVKKNVTNDKCKHCRAAKESES